MSTKDKRDLLLAFLSWTETQPDLLLLGQDEASKYVEMGQSDYEGLVNDYLAIQPAGASQAPPAKEDRATEAEAIAVLREIRTYVDGSRVVPDVVEAVGLAVRTSQQRYLHFPGLITVANQALMRGAGDAFPNEGYRGLPGVYAVTARGQEATLRMIDAAIADLERQVAA